ncbi:MAG: transporter [Candidatus Scalindua sp.]
MQKHYCLFWKAILVCALFTFVLIKNVEANHGPGSGGGSVSTIPALTLRSSSFSFSFNTRMTELETVSRSTLLRKGLTAGSFDAVDRSILYTIAAAYGVTDDFTLGLSLGWFETINFRESELKSGDEAGVEILKANPDGITDMWLTGKYRFFRGPQGHYAFLFGVKFPTGREDSQNNEGEKLEAVEQPGSGSFDFATGIAYSRWLTKDWMLHTSIKYTLKTEGARDYKIGDRIDWGVSTSYQLMPKNEFPNFVPVGGFSVRQLFRDKQNENDLINSGSTTIFISPGFNVGITKNFGINTAFSIPVFQKTLGRQQETDFQASVGFNFHF